MMMRTIRAPESKQATTLLVAVRCRPITHREKDKSRDILRVVDDKVVVVLDPDTQKEYLDRVQGRSKEKKYAFDIAFGASATNQDVYRITVGSMVEGVVRGLNATVFAYGATGSGKTHTMAGTPEDPGLMVLSLQAIFGLIVKQEAEHEFDVTCSYLEVYNEVIYDLLEPRSGHLELREDPDQGITVAGLKRIQVSSAEKILELLNQGNARRKTESTDANATSSRSHAVLEIVVKRKQRNTYRAQVLRGKLALVDLAGSERASETNNAGQKLRDGANINRSLLALANCINALGKTQKKGLAYVPYRNSKLTRLLKDGLSGNSRTVMVATVSSGDDQYHQTINTLKYADRAKEIKTHIQMNVGTVDAHVADYQRMIDNLQVEVSQLRRELAEKETQLSARTSEKTADDELSWLDVLSHDINENVEERINLQKALFELEDTNLHNRAELQQLDELIAEGQWPQSIGKDTAKLEELSNRRKVVLDNIRDNDEAGSHYRQDIEQNEAQRKQLQRMIDEAISSDRNKTFLRILSQYRLLGMTNMELQFQMAVRDQIIHDQREALNNLWLVLECSGLNRNQILKIAAQQGIMIEEGIMPPARGLVPVSPAPTLHKQQNMTTSGPLTTTGPRYPNPNPDLALAKENRAWCDTIVRSESELPAGSPRTPNRDGWRNVRAVDNSYGSNMQVWNNSERVTNPRSKFQDRTVDVDGILSGDGSVYSSGCHYNIGCHTPEKLRRIKTPGSVDSRYSVRGRPTSMGQDQCNGCIVTRGRSPPMVFGPPEDLSPTWQKRRPRSAESRTRQKWGEDRGDERETDREDTAGVDAGSELSDTEEDPDNRDCWTGTTRPDKASALDNDMLRKELSRLDSELQDLKRGIDVSSTMQWSSSVTRSSVSPTEADIAHNRRLSVPLYSGVTKSLAHSTPSGFANGHAAIHSNGGSNGHIYQAAPTYLTSPTGAWDRRSSWGRRESLDSGLNMGLDANGPRVSAFGSAELLDGHPSLVPKMKVIIDRRKSKIENTPAMTRQMWPRHISEWK
ncbi:kinesin family member 19 [Marchantia polymorpha subsp. ruderalis]|uniref:Kinesin-like protein KIN-8B n=1 Tax=Marchantia polymorpha TaxID=3197 RepID=A0A2R6XAP8_MARPO|nr:hypothetical protein MARPO_0026s0062 [Marchantia polymorpha]BBN02137.1 hypothetical protein Mp_2g13100 [Marchantia polymorpha subsp. ruderalis]|eukprot:PTQ43183.1 hypothetical protein MARPO_0026s0062 [Marchantia polymorpha]